MTIIKDWSLQVQWDDSKIKKGIKSLDKTMSKIYSPTIVRQQQRITKAQEKSVRTARDSARVFEKYFKTLENKQAIATNKALVKEQNKLGKSAKVSAGIFQESFERENQRFKQAVDGNKAVTKAQDKVTKSAKASADVFKEHFNEQESLKKKAYANDAAQARFMQQGFERTHNARMAALKKIEDLQYRVNRQSTMVSSVQGGESIKAGIGARQEKLSALQGMLLSGGMTTSAIEDLQKELRGLARETSTANTEVNRLSRSMTVQQSISKGLKDSVHNLARSYLSIFAIGAGATGMYRVGEQLQQIQASLVGVAGSQEGVGKEWDYISSRAKGLGQDLNVMAKGYQQIAMAGKAMGMSEETYKNIFMAASEASAAFNLSVDDAEGVQRAFVQMASKGKISSEEFLIQDSLYRNI